MSLPEFNIKKNNKYFTIKDKNDSFKFTGSDPAKLYQKALKKFNDIKIDNNKHPLLLFLIQLYNEYLGNAVKKIFFLIIQTIFKIFLTLVFIYFFIFILFQNIDDMSSNLYNQISVEKLKSKIEPELSDKEIKVLEIYKVIVKRLNMYSEYIKID